MLRFIRAIEELAKALNRFVDFWEADQQQVVDDLTARLQQSNAVLKASTDKES